MLGPLRGRAVSARTGFPLNQAGILALGSSYSPRLPGSLQWPVWISSPFTAAGPLPNFTGFPFERIAPDCLCSLVVLITTTRGKGLSRSLCGVGFPRLAFRPRSSLRVLHLRDPEKRGVPLALLQQNFPSVSDCNSFVPFDLLLRANDPETMAAAQKSQTQTCVQKTRSAVASIIGPPRPVVVPARRSNLSRLSPTGCTFGHGILLILRTRRQFS